MISKTNKVWFGNDNAIYSYYASWATDYGKIKESNTLTKQLESEWNEISNIMSGVYKLDRIFTHTLYLLTIIGCVLKKKTQDIDISYVFMFIIVGWVLVLMATEMQSRYRYPAMPGFMILTAIGINELYHFSRLLGKCKTKKDI